MCSRLIEALVLLLATGVGAPGARAQEATPAVSDLAEYERLVDRLEALDERERRGSAALLADRGLEMAGLLDTMTVGPFRVVTWRDRRAEAIEQVRASWERDFDPADLPWVREAVGNHVLVLELGRSIGSPIDGTYRTTGRGSMDEGRMLGRVIRRMLLDRVPAAVSSWVGPAGLQGAPRVGALYRIMILSGETAGRKCALGDVGACHTLFGFDDAGTENWAREWFDARSARARALERRIVVGDDLFIVSACREGDQDACFRHLLTFEPMEALPYQGLDRAEIVRFALNQGGPDAMARLLAAEDASPVEALEVTAGVELDTLLADWVAYLRREATVHDGPARRRERGTALAWVSLFVLFSMTNTRWRLG